jgi:hypothetical protein
MLVFALVEGPEKPESGGWLAESKFVDGAGLLSNIHKGADESLFHPLLEEQRHFFKLDLVQLREGVAGAQTYALSDFVQRMNF